MKRLVLVGNGDLPRDLSAVIDGADCVVRFNAARNYDKGSGTKVDVLCLSAGAVHRTERKGGIGVDPEVAQRAEEIWFIAGMWPPQLARAVLERHGLQSKKTRHIPLESERSLLQRMRESSATPLGRPLRPISKSNPFAFRQDERGNVCLVSTGVVTIEYVLSVPEYADYEKCLVGFDWFNNGANVPATSHRVHAWEAEKRLCEDYVAAGRIRILGE